MKFRIPRYFSIFLLTAIDKIMKCREVETRDGVDLYRGDIEICNLRISKKREEVRYTV